MPNTAKKQNPKSDLDAALTPEPKEKVHAVTTGKKPEHAPKKAAKPEAKKPAKKAAAKKAEAKEQPKAKPEAEAKRMTVKEKLAAAQKAQRDASKAQDEALKAATPTTKAEAEAFNVTDLKPHNLISDDDLVKEMKRFGIQGRVEENENGALVCTIDIGNQFVEVPARDERKMASWLRSLYKEFRVEFDRAVQEDVKKVADRLDEVTDENEKLKKEIAALREKKAAKPAKK